MTDKKPREGSLEAPTRHPIDWRSEDFYDEKALVDELESALADVGAFELVEFTSEDSAIRAVERGELNGALIMPAG